MNLNFKQQSVGETVYLVLDMEDGWEIDSFAINMMARNHMSNIIQTQMTQINERQQVQFNITGLVKLNSRIARPRPKKEVLSVLNSILNAFEEADAYMLDMGHLFLEWEYIYLDGQGNCMFLYLPFTSFSGKDKIVFLQDTVSRIQPDYQEKDPYLFDISNAFSRGAIQKLSDFREIIKKSAGTAPKGYREEKETEPGTEAPLQNPETGALKMQKENTVWQEEEKKTDRKIDKIEEKKPEKKTSGVSRIPVINIPGREPGAKTVPPQQEPDKKEKKKNEKSKEKKGLFSRKETSKQSTFFIPGKKKEEETEVQEQVYPVEPIEQGSPNNMYRGYENTVIIQETAAMHRGSESTVILEEPEAASILPAGLLRRQDGCRYPIKGDRVMVGSGTSADICISNNNAISRSHAVILCMNGSYFIEDNQSKNGSFVNGRRLLPGNREPLYDGMILRFANEDFEFFKD